MPEQPLPENEVKAPTQQAKEIKPFYKKMALVVAAGVTAFAPDSKPPILITTTTDPNPSAPVTEITPPTTSSDQIIQEPTVTETPQPNEAPEGDRETEKVRFSPKVTIIDAGLASPQEGINQKDFFQNDDLIKRILGEDYLSEEELNKALGRPMDWSTIYDIAKAADTLKDYKTQILLQGFIHRQVYTDHGKNVAAVMEGTWNAMGLKSTEVELLPLQHIFDKASIKEAKDNLGNEGIRITFDPNRVIELLKDNKSRVVNMSFQVGDVDIVIEKRRRLVPTPEQPSLNHPGSFLDVKIGRNVYIGVASVAKNVTTGELQYLDSEGKVIKPIPLEEHEVLENQLKKKQAEANRKATKEAQTKAYIQELDYPALKIIGASDREKAQENLPKLFTVASTYPGKLFLAAGGNEGEDLREALKIYGNQKPANLLILAQWATGMPKHNVYGADFYVVNSNLGIPEGSSFSTPFVAAYAEMLFMQGLSIEEVKQKIVEVCREREYDTLQGEVEKALIIDDELLPKLDASYWKDPKYANTIIQQLR